MCFVCWMVGGAHPAVHHFHHDCRELQDSGKGNEHASSRPPGVAIALGAESWLGRNGLPPPPSISSHHLAPNSLLSISLPFDSSVPTVFLYRSFYPGTISYPMIQARSPYLITRAPLLPAGLPSAGISGHRGGRFICAK